MVVLFRHGKATVATPDTNITRIEMREYEHSASLSLWLADDKEFYFSLYGELNSVRRQFTELVKAMAHRDSSLVNLTWMESGTPDEALFNGI